MPQFQFVGANPPSDGGNWTFKVRAKGFQVVHTTAPFTVAADTYIEKCLDYHIDGVTGELDYVRV